MTITQSELDELKALMAKATKGPWIRYGVRQKLPKDMDCLWVGPDGTPLFATGIGRSLEEGAQAIRDMDYIAASRNLMPRLIQELEAARKALGEKHD